jgi:hypothetical protein
MWLQLPALNVSDTQQPSDRPSLYKSSIEHYRTCRRVHAGARLLGTITFYQVKRYKLYAVGPEPHSCYEDWAQAFKQHPDNPELRTADMEWLARAGGIITFLMNLEGLPDSGRRADCESSRFASSCAASLIEYAPARLHTLWLATG